MSRPSTTRAVLTASVLVAGGVLAWEFVPLRVAVWSGSYDLSVRFECPGGVPASVACSPFVRRADAESVIAAEDSRSPEWDSVSSPFDGRPITVRIPVGGRDSPFGRQLERWQPKYLAVVATLADDRQVGKVLEIPDPRVSKVVVVAVP